MIVYDHASAARKAAQRRQRVALAAEGRGATEGHQARWDAARGLFLVTPEAGDGPPYELTVGMAELNAPDPYATGVPDRRLTISCTCPAAVKRRAPEPGTPRCKHWTRVARRLERLGLVRFDLDGRWRVTTRFAEVAQAMACEAGEHAWGEWTQAGFVGRGWRRHCRCSAMQHTFSDPWP